jgi:RNA polymerase sigma-70 factor, ECF subfamily
MTGSAVLECPSEPRRSRHRVDEHASDDELVRLIAEGEEAAFKVLTVRHHRLIESACASVILDVTRREDAVQVALVDIWRGLEGFKGGSALTTWMYRVTRNAAVRQVTRKAGNNEVAVDQMTDIPSGDGGWDDATVAREAILVALASLPENQRDALLLHTQAGVPLKEIAEIKIVAEGTVKAWIHRARAEIARQLRN